MAIGTKNLYDLTSEERQSTVKQQTKRHGHEEQGAFEKCSAAFEAIPVVELVLLSCLGRKADLKPHLL